MRNESEPNCIKKCLETIIQEIEIEKRELTNRRLIEICGNFKIFGGGEGEGNGKADRHFCHEIAEGGLNLLIKRIYAPKLLAASGPGERAEKK